MFVPWEQRLELFRNLVADSGAAETYARLDTVSKRLGDDLGEGEVWRLIRTKESRYGNYTERRYHSK